MKVLIVHDGADGHVVGEVPLADVLGLAVSGDAIYALQAEGREFVVNRAAIAGGVPVAWQRIFTVLAR